MKYEYDLTVIIPCYNCCKYVKEAINSLLEQDYDLQKIEILLINDGSTDNTLQILDTYKSDNIIVINKQNEGVSATRNLGMKLAKGRYILFLDSDDYLSRNSLAAIIGFFDAHYNEIDLLTYPMLYFYPNGRLMEHLRYKNCYTLGTSVYDLDKYYYLIQPTLNVCIKNGLDYKFDTNQSYAEDEKFNIKVLMSKNKIGFVKEALYYYRRHSESTTSKRANMDLEKIYSFYNEYQREYGNNKYIQATIMNNLNWRIREECLIPKNADSKTIEYYINSISKRLEGVDFSLFKDHVLDSEEVLLEILSLSGKNLKIECINNDYSLFVDDKVLIDKINNNIYLTNVSKCDNDIVLCGYIVTPLLCNNSIKLYAEILYENNKKENKEVILYNKLDYQKVYKREYMISIPYNKVTKISFNVQIEKNCILLNIKPINWCSKTKVYDNLLLETDQDIKIYKKKILDGIKTRFFYSHKIKFQLINIVSFITRKGNKYHVYFGDKDSSIYQEYINDKYEKKKFYIRACGTSYKLVLLNCDKLITNKSIKVVLPFGKLRNDYIQASHFEIVLKD